MIILSLRKCYRWFKMFTWFVSILSSEIDNFQNIYWNSVKWLYNMEHN